MNCKYKELSIVNIYPIEIKSNDESTLVIIETLDEYVKNRKKLNSLSINLSGIYEDLIKSNNVFRQWIKAMPSLSTLPNILNYKRHFNPSTPEVYSDGLCSDFKTINTTLPVGQILFHGGYWFDDSSNEIISQRYWSTSLTPHHATTATTGYHKDRPVDYIIQLFIIKIMTSGIKFYCYKDYEETRYCEFEVLLDKNIKLIRKKRYFVDCPIGQFEAIEVEAYKL